MLEEISEMNELLVYTEFGVYLGEVTGIAIDQKKCEIDSIILEATNENLVDEGRALSVPFRWIGAIGDIIILKHFPGRVEMTPEERDAWDRQNE